jgi:hypothetical protein
MLASAHHALSNFGGGLKRRAGMGPRDSIPPQVGFPYIRQKWLKVFMGKSKRLVRFENP